MITTIPVQQGPRPVWLDRTIALLIVMLSLPFALVGGWSKVVLTDTDAFVATYAPLIHDERLRGYLTDQTMEAFEQHVDIEALERLLVRFSQLVVEQRWIKEIDINPLLADAAGVRTAVGLGSANLDTQLGNIATDAGNAATNSSNAQSTSADSLIVLQKLDDTLEDNAGTYRFTAIAFNQAGDAVPGVTFIWASTSTASDGSQPNLRDSGHSAPAQS